MKFEFKSLSTYEEDATPNFMGGVNYHSLIEEFDGFIKTEDGKFAFEVRNISLIK